VILDMLIELSVRRVSDIEMVDNSDLNARLVVVQPDPLLQFKGYGDGIFTSHRQAQRAKHHS
jgi:hypothetical protein